MAIKDLLPGRVMVCHRCKAEIVFARTMASPTGTGGKHMPLDRVPNPEGNVAVREVATGVLWCRVLGKDETHDIHTEVRAMPHFRTCQKDLVDGVEAFLRDQAADQVGGDPT